MGYRSQVILVIKDEALDKHITPALKKVLSEYDSISKSERSDGSVWYFEESSVKWYDSYEGVKIVEDLMLKLSDEEFGFIRIGEDLEDFEIKGTPNEFDVFIQRSIDNWNDDVKKVSSEDFIKPNSLKYLEELNKEK